jgi:hypothetical protein
MKHFRIDKLYNTRYVEGLQNGIMRGISID